MSVAAGAAVGDGADGRWRPLAWALAVSFTAVGLVAVASGQFLTNEGVLTWIFAGLMSEAPRDMLFFLKGRPPISVFYAPAAALGLAPFIWLHLLVAALAIPLTAALARHFGHPRPLVPALLLGLSPLYFAAAASGVQNTDATVGVLLAAWLVVRQRPLLAGVVMSLTVLGRVETAVFAIALAGYAIVTPGARRLLPGLLIVPLLYVAAGAAYHGTILWPLRYPSSALNPTLPVRSGSLRDVVASVLALSPVIGVLCWAPLRAAARLETVLYIAALAFVGAVRVLPLTQLIYFGVSPRYLLPALPFFCLAMSRALDGWGNRPRAAAAGALVLVTAILILLPRIDAWIGVVLVAGGAVAVLAAGLAHVAPRLGRGALLAGAAALSLYAAFAPWPVSLIRSTNLVLGPQARELEACARWIAANVPPGAVVVTDQHLLHLWMADHAPDVHADVRHLVQADMLFEAEALTNPATPQFERLFRTARFHYAPWIFRDELDDLPGPVFVLLRTDSPNRLPSMSDPPFDRTEWLTTAPRWRAGRLPR